MFWGFLCFIGFFDWFFWLGWFFFLGGAGVFCFFALYKGTLISKNFYENLKVWGYVRERSLFSVILNFYFILFLLLEEVIVYCKVFFTVCSWTN